jgi:flagellar assembly factor FliW
MLELLHNGNINFNGSILGFEEYDEFQLSIVEQDSPFAYIKSVKDENIGFLVALPFIFYPSYTFEIDEKDKTILNLKTPEEVVVVAIVTIKEPFIQSSINLLAPLVINTTTKQGRQVVLPPRSNYETNEPLFTDTPAESGE